MGGYFSQPEDNSAPEIKVTLESFKQKQAMMPSTDEIERAMAVLTGHALPETLTEEEEEYAPGETNQEKFINDKLLSARFIAGAYTIQSGIGRIVTNANEYGTGFRISENLIMTAAHVLEESSEGYIQFHYYEPSPPNHPGNTIPEIHKQFNLEPDLLYYANDELDFAVIAISGSADELKDVGIISICYIPKTKLTGQHTNIFSHPEGKPMKVSLRQNVAVEQPQKKIVIGLDKGRLTKQELSSKPNVIIHEADTEGGSSGAPVFNDRWQLVAIHQGYTNEIHGGEICVGNYGCLIKYVLENLYSKNGKDLTKFEKALKDRAGDLGIPFKSLPQLTENFRSSLHAM